MTSPWSELISFAVVSGTRLLDTCHKAPPSRAERTTPPASRESVCHASLAPMEPSEAPIVAAAQSHRTLVLPPLLEAIDAWQAEPTVERRNELGRALERVAQEMGLSVRRLRVNAPPLPDLDLD